MESVEASVLNVGKNSTLLTWWKTLVNASLHALPVSLPMVTLQRDARSVMTPVLLVTITANLMTRSSVLTVTLIMVIPGESLRLNFVSITATIPSTLLERALVVNANLHARTVKIPTALAQLVIRIIRRSSLSCGMNSVFLSALRVTL